MSKLVSAYFSGNGSWVCPAGVTRVFVLGQGGGGGGSGGYNNTGNAASAGDATTPYLVPITVVPNTTYTITIGAGGTAGVPRTSTAQNGGTGSNTTFGSLWTFIGAAVQANTALDTGPNGTRFIGRLAVKLYSVIANIETTSGFVNFTQGSGTASGSYSGGRSGTPGYAGSVPGVGGNANNAGTGAAATAGTGFGFGGAGGGAGSAAGGAGGAGGPGQLWVIWVE